MVYKTMNAFLTFIFFIAITMLLSLFILAHNTYAMAASQSSAKATVTLNIQRGPLGVLLTLKGKNFHVGLATVSYRDARDTAGSFGGPGGSSVQIARDGTFLATDELLPASGPAGTWKVVVVDSKGTAAIASYQVIVPPGTQNAGAPSLVVNPISGKPGDVIAFTGSNWLPQGTAVSVRLPGTAGGQLVNAPFTSDKNGAIMGAFRLPQTLAFPQTTATIVATDSTGALQAQIQMSILLPTPMPILTPATAATPVSKSSTSTRSGPTDTSSWLSFFTNNALGVIFLIVGAVLSIAALMLVLFLFPWGRQKGGRQSYIIINHRLHKIAPHQVTLPAAPLRVSSSLESDYFSGVTQPYPSPLAPVDASEQETAEWTVREP